MMRSCLLENPAETHLEKCYLPTDTLPEDTYFATMPMPVIPQTWVPQTEDEEEIYTSFEEAISERVARISRRLNMLPNRRDVREATATRPGFTQMRRFWQVRRRAITLLCLALSLLMAGFDLMGLLMIAR